jgi:hypothetical protein
MLGKVLASGKRGKKRHAPFLLSADRDCPLHSDRGGEEYLLTGFGEKGEALKKHKRPVFADGIINE